MKPIASLFFILIRFAIVFKLFSSINCFGKDSKKIFTEQFGTLNQYLIQNNFSILNKKSTNGHLLYQLASKNKKILSNKNLFYDGLSESEVWKSMVEYSLNFTFVSKLEDNYETNTIYYTDLILSKKLYSELTITNHSKSVDLDIRLKTPSSFSIEEGRRPHVVKKIYDRNTVITITVIDEGAFLTRNQADKLIADSINSPKLDNGYIVSILNNYEESKILNQSLEKISSYPAHQITVIGKSNLAGKKIETVSKIWIVYVEDKVVLFSFGTNELNNFEIYEKLYDQISSTIFFPKQFE